MTKVLITQLFEIKKTGIWVYKIGKLKRHFVLRVIKDQQQVVGSNITLYTLRGVPGKKS